MLLRVKRIGVCGSDIHVWHGKHPFTPYPVVQGHEFSAEVEAVGPGVTRIKPAQRATAWPQETCGVCNPCRRGDYHICDKLKVRGFQAPGCAQDFFVVEEDKVVVFPDTLSFDQGALIEPAAVATFVTGVAVGLVYFLVDLPRDMMVNGVLEENYQLVANGLGIPFMMMGLFLLALCVTVYVIVSLLTPAPVKELEAIHWQPPMQAILYKKFSGMTDPRLMAAILIGIMTVLYGLFR